jgi:hypothetical protein
MRVVVVIKIGDPEINAALIDPNTKAPSRSLVSSSMRRLAMTADLHLAKAHHLLFLLLAGVLAFEIGMVRSNMDREDILRVARVDV